MDSTYWKVGVTFRFINVKKEIQVDEKIWTVWADSVAQARSLALAEWDSRKPKTLIEGSEKWVAPKKLTNKEIWNMNRVFKK